MNRCSYGDHSFAQSDLANHHRHAFLRLEYLEYNATVDFPCFVGYKEMMKWDPRGKVQIKLCDQKNAKTVKLFTV
eukprot:6458143-Amphidinium_carterae.2